MQQLSAQKQTAATLSLIKDMEAALAQDSHQMQQYFADDFVWHGNFGCGRKQGLAEFRRNWQLPFRQAFTDRNYLTRQFVVNGEWASCFGHIEATHSGAFMGIEPTGKRIKIPYMDFWLVQAGKIIENWVSVDFPLVLQQLGHDIFAGKGWEAFDHNLRTPPHP